MLDPIRRIWRRDAVGYRQGELEDGDGMAATVVTVIGGPAFIVGGMLATAESVSVGQVLLIAPVAALLGAFLVGSSASMAAQTGAGGSWLLRPTFGRAGSVFISVLRLLMVGIWAVIALQFAGRWLDGAVRGAGVRLPVALWVVAVALVGFLLLLPGLETTVKRVIRVPLFVASVLVVGLLAWQLGTGGASLTSGGSGSFWDSVERAVEISVVFIPFVESLARRLQDEDEAMSTFSVGYAVPATLMFAAGAILALRLGGFTDLSAIGAAGAGVAVAIAWVVIAEADQAFAAFVAAGSEATGIVKRGDAWIPGIVAVVLIVGAAAAAPVVPTSYAVLVTSLVFPAAVIASFDFHLVKEGYYPEADIYGTGERSVSIAGIGCWVAAVVIGQLLAPAWPQSWFDLSWLPNLDYDLPWRLIAALVAATSYVLIERWSGRRITSVYGVRDVSVYGHKEEDAR